MANLIAEIEAMGQQKKGENIALVVKLKESNGMSFDWTSWHINAFKDCNIGDVVEIVPELKQREDGKRPYRNIGSVVGKRTKDDINMLDTASGQVSASGSSTSPKTANSNGGGRYSSPEAQVYERRSIERQGSVGKVLGFLEQMSLEDLENNLERLLTVAGKIEAHVQRDGGLVWPVGRGESAASTQPISRPRSIHEDSARQGGNGQSNPVDFDIVPETVPQLLTMAVKRWSKNRRDVCDVFAIPEEEWKDIPMRAGDIGMAWETLMKTWDGPE